jgi:4-hydroxybenzoate polyprenyltransferase
MRPHQWVKNFFVLAPLVFARALENTELVPRAGAAFLAFCALASAVYLMNDVRDRDKDRLHPIKKNRPIAAGKLSPSTALTAALVLALLALGLGAWLGLKFLVYLLTYLVLNVGYTLVLKHVVILDVMSVAGCYLLRVLAGAAAIDVAVSDWLLLCTASLALFLVFSKRRHELILLSGSAQSSRAVLSHYSPQFLDQMTNVVTASTLITYVLYTRDGETVEKFGTHLILTIPFVLYGIFRYLYLVYQKTGERNPTEALLLDRPFLINLGMWAATVLLVLYAL